MNIRIRSELTHNNKIRVFESFSGVGTQAMGLEQLKQYSKEFHNLDIGYEVVGTSDWNIPSIKSYGEIHINHNSDRAKLVRQVVDNTTKEDIIEALLPLNLSVNDKEVATIDNYRRKKETELRDIAYYTIMGNNLGNIQGIKGSQITDLDLFTFSFPCQDISTAGKGQGFKDTTTRSGLVWEVIRILKEQTFEERPKVLLMENVKALTFKKFKEGWEELQEIIKDMGYTNHIKIMDARDYGVAQSRERVIMVSIRNDIDVNYNFPQAFELTKVLRDYLETDVDKKYYLSEEQINRVVNSNFAQEKNRIHDENGPVSTILARDWKDPKAVRIEQLGQLYGLGKEKNPVAGRVYTDMGLSPTLDTMQGGNRMPIIMTDNVSSGRIVTRDRNNVPRGPQLELRDDDVSNCLTTFSKDSLVVEEVFKINVIGNYNPSGHSASRVVSKDGVAPTVMENHSTVTATKIDDHIIRKLTPKECWRLMGIPDTYTDKAMKIQSNSQLYKQAGNAIVVDVLYHTFRTLYLEGER